MADFLRGTLYPYDGEEPPINYSANPDRGRGDILRGTLDPYFGEERPVDYETDRAARQARRERAAGGGAPAVEQALRELDRRVAKAVARLETLLVGVLFLNAAAFAFQFWLVSRG